MLPCLSHIHIYPPSRGCDPSIPLLPAASPVFSRPYRFAPAIKTEVEKQVQEMLTAGIIQKSSSPFSSAVLLVKKKDNTWDFALTIVSLMLLHRKASIRCLLLMSCSMNWVMPNGFPNLIFVLGFIKFCSSPAKSSKLPFRRTLNSLSLK